MELRYEQRAGSLRSGSQRECRRGQHKRVAGLRRAQAMGSAQAMSALGPV